MECHVNYSKMKREKSKEMNVFTPYDWHNMLRMISAGKSKKMFVRNMKFSDFIN